MHKESSRWSSLIDRIKNFSSYLIVGAGATLVEWIVFYILDHFFPLHYLWATGLSFLISTFFNWLFGRLLTFRHAPMQNVAAEIAKIYLASLGGLGLNLLFMWFFVDICHLAAMPSKIVTTGLVFFYNFFVRVLVIYRKGEHRHE